MSIRKDLTLRIDEIISETPDTKTFRFYLPPGEQLDFLPGQFVSLVMMVPDASGEPRKRSRAFSIASSPTETRYLDLTVKINMGGEMTPYLLYHAQVGEEVRVKGPKGTFTFQEGMGERLLLIAGGSGIVPSMCLLRYLVAKDLPVRARLLYAAKTPEDLIFRKDLDAMAAAHPRIRIDYTITKPQGTGWTGRTGRIDEPLLREVLNESSYDLVYLCGPPPMVEHLVTHLLALGYPPERIKTEKWV
ncbi:MAG: ferredoxin reductase [Nitrospirae bacterium]|nr:ferredoxin reductase [Nitrospirota bacterium]